MSTSGAGPDGTDEWSAADQAPRSRDDGNPEDAVPAAHRTTIKESTA
ncbi:MULTISPECIES: hypothetical protein [unclassified Streptomyces]|nr:hypothetical protein [Streptomyces sp. M92]WCN05951.1 hypothetical protein M6G08_29865 [Streptomyces sp. M92]